MRLGNRGWINGRDKRKEKRNRVKQINTKITISPKKNNFPDDFDNYPSQATF